MSRHVQARLDIRKVSARIQASAESELLKAWVNCSELLGKWCKGSQIGDHTLSEKQTQIGQISLNLWEPRWTLTTKISKSFALSAKVPGGQPAASVPMRQRTTQAVTSVRPWQGGGGGEQEGEAQQAAGRGKNEGLTKGRGRSPFFPPQTHSSPGPDGDMRLVPGPPPPPLEVMLCCAWHYDIMKNRV